MAGHNTTGNLGEQLAVQFLQKAGFTLLHQNWRHGHLEVDIIAQKNNILHFVEVKTRRTKTFGHPEESVGKKKMQNLVNASAEYLYQFPQWQRIQFDILSITLIKGSPTEYFLIEDVYLQ